VIEIDGSYLEGGGQILRTAVSLSIIKQVPFRISKIRANRPKPGLQPQHLTAVNAAAKICNAKIKGNKLGSEELVFESGPIEAGDYFFDIGTAGSCVLFLQTLLPVLVWADRESKIIVRGGTHVIKSPSFEYFKYCFLPNIRKMGIRVEAEMRRPGFYPQGGGEVMIQVLPSRPRKCEFTEPGAHKNTSAYLVSANLPMHILDREENILRENLAGPLSLVKNSISNNTSTGNAITIIGEYENYCIGADGLGQKGKPAEAVAKEVVSSYKSEEAGGAPDSHMVDQLLLYLALAGRGNIKYGELTQHSRTNIYTISKIWGEGSSLVVDEERKQIYFEG